MTSAAALNTLFFAGECFFGGSLILGAAWLLARGRAAAMRHLVWTAAFAALLALPVAGALMPARYGLALLPADPAPVVADVVVSGNAPAHAVVPVQMQAPAIGAAEIVEGLATVWLAGVAFLAAKLLAGWVGLMLLRRRSVPHIPHGIDARLFAQPAPRWQLRLRTAPGEAGAMTWGVLEAIVLLPKTSVLWPREKLEAVLLHEFAHVRRRDSLARLIAAGACALYWPNPFVWSSSRLMRRDAEMAADDAVLSSGVKPSSYAEQLLDLAARTPTYAGVSLSMAEPSTLKARVQAVLSAGNERSGVTKMDVLKVAALGLALTGVFAVARPGLAAAAEGDQSKSVTVETRANLTDINDAKHQPSHLTVHAKADRPDHVIVNTSDDEAPGSADVTPPEPPAPPSDVAPAAPPAPPAPPAALAPPAPPAPPVVIPDRNAMAGMHREMARQAAEMKKAQAAIQKAQAEVQRALTDAKIDETVAKALKDAQPALEQARRVNAEVVRRAIEQAHIAERVHEAMERVKPEIQKAIAEAHHTAQQHEEQDEPDRDDE